MKFVSGWQTILKFLEGNIELYTGENYYRLDLTWHDGIDWKLINSGWIK